MQLNLFEWDIIAVGNGYQGLAGLDFNTARRHFSRVLEVLPDHPVAKQGMKDLHFWENIFHGLEGLDLTSSVSFLWDRIAGFPFKDSENFRTLRRTLIKRLLAMMDNKANLYIPPDLCSGYLYLQLEDYAAAETHLRILLEHLPDNGRLYGYLADALWMGGQRVKAGKAYARALLLAPHEVSVTTLCNQNQQLCDVIQEHGAALAPIHGYLAGFLPLIEQEIEAITPEARAYELLRQAEQARSRNNHNEMIKARRRLKELAPKVLQDYLDRMVSPYSGRGRNR